jgi:hypothetical protein
MTDERYPVDAPGWVAIDRAALRICPAQTPHQFSSRRAYDLEGTSPLPAITVWEGPQPDHWMYVTYGLSELFDKSSARADVSGFGFELVMRLPRAPGQEAPPTWPLSLLQGIGHYVLSGHGTLDSGHVIDLGGPLVPESGTALRGVVCVPDPRMGKIDTPHGTLLFLALLGLTADEVEAMQDWDLPRKVGLVAELEPAAVTRPDRVPFAEDPEAAPIFRRYATKVLI